MEKKNEKKRSEHLSTTIGDMMRLQGNDILKTEKKHYQKNNKKKNNKKFDKKPQEKKVEKVVEAPVVEEKPEPKVNESLKAAIDKAVEKGILRADDTVKFDMRSPEQIEADIIKEGVIIEDGNMEEFASAFLAPPNVEGPKMDDGKDHIKFTINSDYISKEGSDARVRTDEFITK